MLRFGEWSELRESASTDPLDNAADLVGSGRLPAINYRLPPRNCMSGLSCPRQSSSFHPVHFIQFTSLKTRVADVPLLLPVAHRRAAAPAHTCIDIVYCTYTLDIYGRPVLRIDPASPAPMSADRGPVARPAGGGFSQARHVLPPVRRLATDWRALNTVAEAYGSCLGRLAGFAQGRGATVVEREAPRHRGASSPVPAAAARAGFSDARHGVPSPHRGELKRSRRVSNERPSVYR